MGPVIPVCSSEVWVLSCGVAAYCADCRHFSSKCRLVRGYACCYSESDECIHTRLERGSLTDCDSNVVTNSRSAVAGVMEMKNVCEGVN